MRVFFNVLYVCDFLVVVSSLFIFCINRDIVIICFFVRLNFFVLDLMSVESFKISGFINLLKMVKSVFVLFVYFFGCGVVFLLFFFF